MSNLAKRTPSNPVSGPTRRWAGLSLLVVLGAVACDPAPTALDGTVDAVAAVEPVWNQLPSTMELESEALSIDGSSEEDEAFVLLAADVAAEADVARALGVTADADGLETAADTLATRGLLARLGRARADAVLRSVENALERIESQIGADADAETRMRLDEAADALARAHAALADGDVGSALMHAGAAADALRWLHVEAKAEAAVEHALGLLARARALAGSDPDEPIARALARAEARCSAASVALEGGRWRLAITEAHLCARLSRAIIVRLGGGIDDAALEARAGEAVAHAEALYEKAVEEAGDVVAPRVALLLVEAKALLERARLALEEDRYRAAIGLSLESSARSLRAIRILRADASSPAELRARAAVETARGLSARVDAAVIGAPQVIIDAAARADGLVAEAGAALESGAWRKAWWLARTAIAVYTRILLALA